MRESGWGSGWGLGRAKKVLAEVENPKKNITRELQNVLKSYAQASGQQAPLCRRVLKLSEKDPLNQTSLLCTGVEDAGFF